MDEPVPRRPLGRSLREASKAVGCVSLGPLLLLTCPVINLICNHHSRSDQARFELQQLEKSLQLHVQRTGRLPTEAEGLRELVTSGALERLPQDPWGNEYGYSLQDGKARVWSLGADGAPGGEGSDEDLVQEVPPKLFAR